MVTEGYLSVTVGKIRMGLNNSSISYLMSNVGHIRVTVGLLWVTIGYLGYYGLVLTKIKSQSYVF